MRRLAELLLAVGPAALLLTCCTRSSRRCPPSLGWGPGQQLSMLLSAAATAAAAACCCCERCQLLRPRLHPLGCEAWRIDTLTTRTHPGASRPCALSSRPSIASTFFSSHHNVARTSVAATHPAQTSPRWPASRSPHWASAGQGRQASRGQCTSDFTGRLEALEGAASGAAQLQAGGAGAARPAMDLVRQNTDGAHRRRPRGLPSASPHAAWPGCQLASRHPEAEHARLTSCRRACACFQML